MKYIQFVNQLIRNKLTNKENIVVFGQNITAGSCLSGLTGNIQIKNPSFILNTQNSENTLVGMGFGLMMAGVDAIFFMKQQDFLLLGIDHLVNTYNIIRRKDPRASFTIFFIIVDQGYQGAQSSLNNFADFCSMARVPGFTITNKTDAEKIINKHLISPGFRMIGVGQRLFEEEIIDIKEIYSNNNATLFKYFEGNHLTTVCFNLSFPYGFKLYEKLKDANINSSLFNVNALTPIDWHKIIEDVKKTRKIIIIDDSKSENLSAYNLLYEISDKCQLDKKIIIKRDFSKDWLAPNSEILNIDYDEIITKLSS